MFRLYEVVEKNAGANVSGKARVLPLATVMAVLVMTILVLPSEVTAKDNPQSVSEEMMATSSEATEFKSDILERYRVLLLQGGLLLESRQEGAAAGAIEISEGHLSVDGEEIRVADLEGLVGDDANLISRLTEIDSEQLHLIFGRPSEAPSEVEESEVTEMWAPEADRPSRAPRGTRLRRTVRHSDPKIALGAGLTVDEDEIVKGDVTVFGGPAVIKGEVRGDVVVFANEIRVEGGKVQGDVTAIGGSISLDADAEIRGSAHSVGGAVDRHEDAVVRGDVVEVPFSANFNFDILPKIAKSGHQREFSGFDISPFKRSMKIMWQIFSVLMLGLLGCLVLLLAPRPLKRVEQKVISEPWKSGLVGFLGQVLSIPVFVIVLILLVVSIIGIPLAILWIPTAILGCLLVSFLGYSAVALRLGRWAEQRFGWNFGGQYVQLLIGVVLINGWAVAGETLSWGWGPLKVFSVMFFVLGFVLCYVTWTIGFGAALLTRFGTADGWSRGGAPITPPPPVTTPSPTYSSDEVIDLPNEESSIESADQVDEAVQVDPVDSIAESSDSDDWADESTDPLDREERED